MHTTPYNPHNSFIDIQNPPFWVATHLYEKETYIVYREVATNTHREIKVSIRDGKLKHRDRLTIEEKMYFKRNKLI